MSRPLVRVVFALLVLATIAAFLVTQQLKSEFPLVIRFAAKPPEFSPNGDGYADRIQLGFDLSEPATGDLLGDERGGQRGAPAGGRPGAERSDAQAPLPVGRPRRQGTPVPDGLYRMRVVRRDEGRVIDSLKEITVDRRPPRAELAVRPPECDRARRAGPATRGCASATRPANQAPVFRVFRTDQGPPRRGAPLPRRPGPLSGVGRPPARRAARRARGLRLHRPGARSRRQRGHGPAPMPTARIARPGTGVSVRPFTLRGPLSVVPAGAFARLGWVPSTARSTSPSRASASRAR